SRLLYGGVVATGRAGVIDVATGQRRVKFDKHDNTVMDVILSADGTLAASTGGNADDVFIWKIENGEIVRHLKGPASAVWGLGWSRDGTHVAFGNVSRGDQDKRPI